MNREQIKAMSKAQLGGNIFSNTWLMALLCGVIISAIVSVITPVAAGFTPIILLVSGPLAYAMDLIFLKIIRGNPVVKLEDLFAGFKNDFGGVFLLGLMTWLFTALWTLLFIIPGIVKAYAYSMGYFIKIDHPEYDWNACLKESMRLTDGHKADLFVLDLSFIGWYIVGALCLGVGVLWVMPYHRAARANYYEALKQFVPQAGAQ